MHFSRNQKESSLPINYQNKNLLQDLSQQLKKDFSKCDQQTVTKLLRNIYQEAQRFKNLQKYPLSKKYFDQFYQGHFESFVKSCQLEYYNFFKQEDYQLPQNQKRAQKILQEMKNSNKSIYQDAINISLQQLLKFKNEFNHKDISQNFSQLDKNLFNQEEQESNRQINVNKKQIVLVDQQVIKKLLIPNILNRKLKLINRKYYFYKSIGQQKSILQAEKLLILDNKSTVALYSPNCYSNVIKQAIKLKKVGQLKKACQMLKQTIYNSKTFDQGEKFYLARTWVKYLKKIDQDGNQILTALDKFWTFAELDFDRAEILAERKQILLNLSKNKNLQNHKGLVKYYEEKIKKSSKIVLQNTLNQYSSFLKIIGQKTQQIKVYSLLIQVIDERNIIKKSSLLKEQSALYSQLGKKTQAQKCFQKAQKIYSSHFDRQISFLWKNKMSSKTQEIIQNYNFFVQQNYCHIISRAIKLKNAGQIKKSCQLLKQHVFKQKLYLKGQRFYLAKTWVKYLRLIDHDGHQILPALDKYFTLTDLDLDRYEVLTQRRYVLNELSKIGNLENHKGLTKYYEEKTKKAQRKNIQNILYEYLTFLKCINEKQQAIKICIQLLQNTDRNHTLKRSQILKQQAILYMNIGKHKQGWNCFQKAQSIYPSKFNDRVRFLWKSKMFKQIDDIIKSTKNVSQLKTIALLYKNQGDRLVKNNSPKDLIIQNYKKSVELFDQTLRMSQDYCAIKSLFSQQQICLKALYNYTNTQIKEAKQHQYNLLKQMKILDDYIYMQNLMQQTWKLHHKNKNKDQDTYQKGIQIKRLQIIKDNKILKNTFLSNSSLKQLLNPFQGQRKNYFFLKQIISSAIIQGWNNSKYIESLKLFQKLIFIQGQNNFINQQKQISIVRKVYHARKQYQKQNYNQCLHQLQSIYLPSSTQKQKQIIYLGNKDMCKIIQTYQHSRNYQLAVKMYLEMVYCSQKNLSSYFVTDKNNHQQQIFQLLRKYNAVLHSAKSKKYQKCINKMNKLQKLFKQYNQQIKDPKFYSNFAIYNFQYGKRLKQIKSQKFVDNYCQFIVKYKKSDQMKQIEKNSEIHKMFLQSQKLLTQLFFNEIKKTDDQLRTLRDFYFSKPQVKIKYQEIKEYMSVITKSISNCQKVQDLNLVNTKNKIQELKTLKYCWSQTCFVLYKQVINKGVSDKNYNQLKQLIEDLQSQFMNFQSSNKKDHSAPVDPNMMKNLSKVAKQLEQTYKQEFQAMFNQKLKLAQTQVKEMNQAMNRLKQQIQKGSFNNNQSPNQIISQLVKDNLQMKQQNQFFIDLIEDLQNRLNQQNQDKNEQKDGNDINMKEKILQHIQEFKNNNSDELTAGIQLAKQQMNKALKTFKQSLNNLQLNKPENMNNNDLLRQLVASHQQMKDQNCFFSELIDKSVEQNQNLTNKLESLQKLINGLEGLSKNTNSVFDIQKLLKDYLEKHSFEQFNSQSQQQITKMMTFFDQNSLKQYQLQAKLIEYINKNITKLLDYITNILDPNLDVNIDKYFKRFKDDLYLRDNKIKELLDRIAELQAGYSNKNGNSNTNIKLIQQQIKLTKQKVQDNTNNLKTLIDHFDQKANIQDLNKLKDQLLSRYLQTEDIAKRLELLSNDTLLGNYHDLLDNLDYLKNYVAINDKKINILSQKLGTKIVTSFNNMLRNDQVKQDKHGKFKFLPQQNQIQMNVNYNSQNNNIISSNSRVIDSQLSNKQQLKKGGRAMFRSRNKNQMKDFKPMDKNNNLNTDGFRLIDKGTKKIDLQGQLNRKVNVVIMQNSKTFQY